MDAIDILVMALKEKQVISPLEQDILDTYHTMTKIPFDRASAIQQAFSNNSNHPDMLAKNILVPDTATKSLFVATDQELAYNLYRQLVLLIEKRART